METIDLFERLSVALAIGLLIGLERGWRAREEAEGERAAGLRTHALAGLLGGVWGAIAYRSGSDGGAIALGLAFTSFSVAIVLFRYREIVHDETYGATTVVAAMLSFGLGALAVIGDPQVAAAGGVAAAALLALKGILHAWVKQLTWQELRSALLLMAMTFIMLPLLPNRFVDPWNAVNPHEVWLFTILIAALSFTGYFAIKTAGESRGILITGVAGGLVSSTAVTLTLSRLAREHPSHVKLLTAGILMAGATMVARVLIIVGAVNWRMIPNLLPPLGIGGIVLVAGALLMMRDARNQHGNDSPLDLGNPFDLATVLKLGAALTAIMVLAKLAAGSKGNAGAYALAAISGIADVDAISLSMARLAPNELETIVGARAIVIAVAVNTVAKTIMAWMAGGAGPGRRLLLVSGLALAAGLSAAILWQSGPPLLPRRL